MKQHCDCVTVTDLIALFVGAWVAWFIHPLVAVGLGVALSTHGEQRRRSE